MINRRVLQWIVGIAIAMASPGVFALEFTVGGKKVTVDANKSQFVEESNTVVFEGDVKIQFADFSLTCDTLEITLSTGEKALQGGILQKAVASGHLVQLERPMDDGDLVAKSRLATYDASTGQVIMSDYPVIEKGGHVLRGAAPETRIVLNKNGKYSVEGKHVFQFALPGNFQN